MAGLSEAKLKAVRMLVQSAPDSAIRSLTSALAAAADPGLATVRDMLRDEAVARRTRAAVFHPVSGLFEPGPYGPARFPAGTAALLWRLLAERVPDAVREASVALAELRAGDPSPAVFDALCAEAAELVTERPEVFGETAADLTRALASVPLIRRVTDRMPKWLGRADEDDSVALRLVFKDAAAIAEDGVPFLLDILRTRMAEPRHLLRLVSVALERPSDSYLAESELADLGVALLDDVDEHIEQVKRFDPTGGAAAGRDAGREAQAACAVLQEFEETVELGRDGPWGRRVAAQKRALAQAVETRLREIDHAIQTALPLQTVRIVGRMSRGAPRMSEPPDAEAVARTRGLLSFLDSVRSCAAYGGFGSLRAKAAEKAAERLATYADEAVAAINAFETEDEDLARVYVELAAEFLGLAEDPKTAQIVRRRAAVAGSLAPSQQSA